MAKIVRLTEQDLVRLVNRVIKEQEGKAEKQTSEYDYWNKLIVPILTKEGFKLVDETKILGGQKCPYACCKYFAYPNHSSGVNLFLDCGNDPSRNPWKLTVYYQGNKGVKSFDVASNSQQAAGKAVDYALALKNKLYPSKNETGPGNLLATGNI
jgi:hypothetical protein